MQGVIKHVVIGPTDVSRRIPGESIEQRENISAVNLCRISTARGGCDFGSGLQKSRREQGDQRLGNQRPGQAEVLSESWVSPLGGLESQDLGVCQRKQKRRISQAKMELSAWKAASWGWDTCLEPPFSQNPISI